jgi:glycosyltransferase involved in cell wall biosynthesis
MRVLLANKYFSLKGGAETVFFQERDFLLKNGVEVIDFSMRTPDNVRSDYEDAFLSTIDYQSACGTIGKIRQAARFIHSSEAIYKLERLVDKKKPDIAHLHNIYHQITPAIISRLKKLGVKTVLTLHDGKLVCPKYLMLAHGKVCTACRGRRFWKVFVRNCVGSRQRAALLMLEAYWHRWKRSYDMVDLFLSPSRFLADLISARIPRDKIRLLPNGIALESQRPSFKDNGYALYLGRISGEKGIQTLLEAHERLGNGLGMRIVGTGPLEKELRQRFEAAEFLGYQSGPELAQTVSEAAFLVVPSEWYENCPMVVLEAMAMGKPVIGSRIGGIPEQVDDGSTGLLFEMGNVNELAEKMKLLSEDLDMRREMGIKARKKVEKEYSLKKHCDRLMRIYEEISTKN